LTTTGTNFMPNHALPLIDRPSLTLLGTEPWRAAIEFLSHKLSSPLGVASGDGHPVVIFPGLGTDGTAVAPLRAHCQALGYDAFDWGEGFNTGPQGDIDEWLAELAARVSASLSGFDQSATLIGWSLGGLYARELGKLLEPHVRQVITIATPFNATGDHTNVGWLYRLLGGNRAAFDPVLSERLKTAPPVPTTSIYSRSDGVVAWQTCLHDRPSSEVQDIEIHGSHIGMGWNKAALAIIGDRLAQRPGKWRPYSPAAASPS
jgi:pimeloyl-ACP methyl ester carboxylesterase